MVLVVAEGDRRRCLATAGCPGGAAVGTREGDRRRRARSTTRPSPATSPLNRQNAIDRGLRTPDDYGNCASNSRTSPFERWPRRRAGGRNEDRDVRKARFECPRTGKCGGQISEADEEPSDSVADSGGKQGLGSRNELSIPSDQVASVRSICGECFGDDLGCIFRFSHEPHEWLEE